MRISSGRERNFWPGFRVEGARCSTGMIALAVSFTSN